jgi:metal-responsive CopG/Arc/MetJ family transcriptional regulator
MWILTHMIMVTIMMKTVQMTINEDLLIQIDQVVKDEGSNRSAFMRQALKEALRRYNIAKLEKQHTAGYLQHPIKPDEFDDWQEEQAWGDEWNEAK